MHILCAYLACISCAHIFQLSNRQLVTHEASIKRINLISYLWNCICSIQRWISLVVCISYAQLVYASLLYMIEFPDNGDSLPYYISNPYCHITFADVGFSLSRITLTICIELYCRSCLHLVFIVSILCTSCVLIFRGISY